VLAEELERTKRGDPVPSVPHVHISDIAAGNGGIIGRNRSRAPTSKHDENLDELCPRVSHDDRCCNRHVEPVRSADLSLERRAAALTQAKNVTPADAVDLIHIRGIQPA
jgi:hypothetical protein